MTSFRPSLFSLVLLSAIVLAGMVGPVASNASVPEGVTLREMTVSASTILHGKVLGTSSRWNEARTLIVTDVRVEVISAIKGAPAAMITLTQPGGTVGKLRVDVPGAAPFASGEEVVLFLREDPDGRLQVPGLSRGRFDVIVDRETGRRFVRGIPAGGPAEDLVSPDVRLDWADVEGRVHLERFLKDVGRLVEQAAETPNE